MRKLSAPENKTVVKSQTATLKDGSAIRIDYITAIEDMHKHGYLCDGVEAYIDGKKVGYLKFDYFDPKMLKDYPTNYHIASTWGGSTFIYPFELTDTYYTVSFDRLVKWAKEALHILRPYSITKEFPDLVHDLENSYHTPITEDRRPEIVNLLKAIDKSPEMKEKIAPNLKAIRFYINKPFVAYSQAGMSQYQGLNSDNRGRGVGMLMYREAAKWIIQRGIGKGLYASGNQSGDAQIIWDVFAQRGWVKHDGKRRYLVPD